MSTRPISLHLLATRRDAEQEQLLAANDNTYQIETVDRAPWLPDDPLLDPRYIEPLQMLVVASLSKLVQRLRDAWLRDHGRGVEIRLDTRPPLLSRIAGIPGGYLVLSRGGKAVIAVRAADYDAEGLHALLAPYLGGL